ncbi:AraC family transcriptional regulator [Actinoplanes friuliensis]|uniref:Shy25-AraC-family transcriptional regulator n=1 Tax=Actinoplanes friuliensis DSM 7358 TaxID=1246995 RepID=U5W2A2_9ACTN|nr:AraC family transcriptional regulator [Actinoplanes friuliensis]AGZ42100.1 Shy25-AraC-family transcriptional regulator [Actinoplanes friuliensis DSM 7358]
MALIGDLRDLLDRHAPREGPPLPGVVLLRADGPTEPVSALSDPVFVIVASGRKRTILADRVFEYGAGQYLVVSVELPVTAHVIEASRDEPYLVFAMCLQPEAIATLLLETADSRRLPREVPGLAVSEATDDLLDPVVRLLRLLDRPADLPVLAPAAEREILWRLVTGEQGAMIRQIGLADSRLSQVARSIRWIREHYADLFRIEDAARVAGMSVTSFHRHFRAVTTMSPLQFQKQVRLQQARTRLIANPHDVAAVGHDVGYDSPSQFSREYRRMFGVPPGRDAVRLQAVAAGPIV